MKTCTQESLFHADTRGAHPVIPLLTLIPPWESTISYFLHPATSPLSGSRHSLSSAECVGRNNTTSQRLCGVIQALGRRRAINIQLRHVRVGKMNFSGSTPSELLRAALNIVMCIRPSKIALAAASRMTSCIGWCTWDASEQSSAYRFHACQMPNVMQTCALVRSQFRAQFSSGF